MGKIKSTSFSFFVTILFSISIFLWSAEIYFIQLRFLYLILIFPAIYQFFTDRKIEKTKQKILIFFFLLLIFFSVINFLNLNLRSLVSSVIIFLSIIIIIYYGKFLKNVELIVYTFLSFFLVSFLLTGEILIPKPFDLINTYDNWTNRCGGIPIKLFYEFSEKNIPIEFKENLNVITQNEILSFKIGVKEFFFKENSHISIISPAIILFLISKYCDSKNLLFKIFIIIVCFLLYQKTTTVFFLTIVPCFIIIYVFNYKFFSKKKVIIYFIVMLFISINFISDEKCIHKIDSLKIKITNFFKNNSSKLLTTNSKINNKNITTNHENIFIERKNKENINNLSLAVFYRAFEIAKKSIIDKPFGWGINNYIIANQFYNDENFYFKRYKNFKFAKDLNNHDASSTAIKMIVEIGLFFLGVIGFIFYYIIKKNIPLTEKLFYVTLILAQFIRGVGYFNSGFIIIFLFIVIRCLDDTNETYKNS
jgi:hypothetical protein